MHADHGLFGTNCAPDGPSYILSAFHKACASLCFTGLLLAAATLHGGVLPGIMHLRNPNAHIGAALEDWRRRSSDDSGGGYLPRQATPAAGAGYGRLAAASSFGMSGVNAHVLLGSPEVQRIASQVRGSIFDFKSPSTVHNLI